MTFPFKGGRREHEDAKHHEGIDDTCWKCDFTFPLSKHEENLASYIALARKSLTNSDCL